MSVVHRFVRFFPALLLAVPLAAQDFSLDFRDSTIYVQEGRTAEAVLVLTGTTESTPRVDFHYTIGDAEHQGHSFLYHKGKTVYFTILTPNDKIYTDGQSGTITATYLNNHTMQTVTRTAAIEMSDNEGIPSAAFHDDVRVIESEGGTHSLTLHLKHQSIFPTTVGVHTCCGTATAGSDFDLLDTSIIFAPMQLEAEVRFTVDNDGPGEGAETFNIYSSYSSGAPTVTIVEDDLQPVFSPDTLRVMAGEPFELDVALQGSAPGPFGASIDTTGGITLLDTSTAMLGIAPKTLHFRATSPGMATVTVTPASQLYSPATAWIEIYDVGFDVDPFVQPLRAGDELTTYVRMNPAGTGYSLMVDVTPAGVVQVSPQVNIGADGVGELSIKALKAGTADIRLMTPWGKLMSYFDVKVIESLAVLSVAPNEGPSTGGTNVTITGVAFRGTCSVKFGDVPATAVTRVDETTLRATTAKHAHGIVDVTVTCDQASAKRAAAFTFNPVRGRAVRH